MTRKELHDAIADAVEADFQPGKLRSDGSPRPFLTREDAEHIANRVFSVTGKSGLGIYEVPEDEA